MAFALVFFADLASAVSSLAAAQLRAPLFEDKVVDFLFERSEMSERTVTRDALEAAIESEEGHVHGPGCGHDHHDHGGKAKAKGGKTAAPRADAAGKPKAKKASAKDRTAEAKPAKKTSAKAKKA